MEEAWEWAEGNTDHQWHNGGGCGNVAVTCVVMATMLLHRETVCYVMLSWMYVGLPIMVLAEIEIW